MNNPVITILRSDPVIKLIDQLDVDPDDSMYTVARLTDFDDILLTWNGIPGDPADMGPEENISQAVGPDVFEGVNEDFNRMLPAITLGEPAPPPLYYARSVIFESGNPNNEYHVAYHPIYVPQVVKLKYDADAIDLLRSPLHCENDPEIVLYEYMEDENWTTFTNSHRIGVQALFENNVNIRIVGADTEVVGPCSTVTMEEQYGGSYPENQFGLAEGDYPNTNPSSKAWIYVYSHRYHIQKMWDIQSGFEFSLPITVSELAYAFSAVTAHEIGHTLGLVKNNDVLDGDIEWHNKAATSGPEWVCGALMNPGGQTPEMTGWAMV